MAVDINVWAYLLFNFMNVCAIERMMNLFFGKRKTSLLPWLASFLLYYVATSIVFLFLNITWITMTVNVIIYFIISLNYEVSWKKRIVGVFSAFSVLLSLETAVVILIVDPYISFSAGISESTIGAMIFMGIFIYLTALLLNRFRNIKTNHLSSPIHWLISLMIPIGSVIVVWFTVFLPVNIAVVLIIILFIINFAFFYYQDTLAVAYEEKIKSALDSQEKEYYFAQNELMVETVEAVKGIRHDMKLHLATLENYIKDSPEEALAYVSHLLGDIGKNEVYSDTGNVALDSIINFKLKSAKDDGIEVSLDIFAPAVIGIETPDVVIIVGNLLDNALEAVAKVEDKFINIHIAYEKGNLLIRVENSFDGVIRADPKTDDLATIKLGDGHGYGLKNVRKSADKYHGKVDVAHENNLFVTKALLYGQAEN